MLLIATHNVCCVRSRVLTTLHYTTVVDGGRYYYNNATGESRWVIPSLSPNTTYWERCLDEDSGRFYYHHVLTDVSQWELPEGERAVHVDGTTAAGMAAPAPAPVTATAAETGSELVSEAQAEQDAEGDGVTEASVSTMEQQGGEDEAEEEGKEQQAPTPQQLKQNEENAAALRIQAVLRGNAARSDVEMLRQERQREAVVARQRAVRRASLGNTVDVSAVGKITPRGTRQPMTPAGSDTKQRELEVEVHTGSEALQQLHMIDSHTVAARAIQRTYRGMQGRRRVPVTLFGSWQQRWDDGTPRPFYYNSRTKVTQWEPPLPSSEHRVSLHRAPSGRVFYHDHTDGTSTWTMPAAVSTLVDDGDGVSECDTARTAARAALWDALPLNTRLAIEGLAQPDSPSGLTERSGFSSGMDTPKSFQSTRRERWGPGRGGLAGQRFARQIVAIDVHAATRVQGVVRGAKTRRGVAVVQAAAIMIQCMARCWHARRRSRSMVPVQLCDGWMQEVDPDTSKTFFFNPSTGDLSWEAPLPDRDR